MGAPDKCYALSEAEELDRKELLLVEALDEVVGRGMGTPRFSGRVLLSSSVPLCSFSVLSVLNSPDGITTNSLFSPPSSVTSVVKSFLFCARLPCPVC
jgi:hypothetical protein